MARPTSSRHKKQGRALADLENFDKAMRRGQRPAVFMVLDAWLDVPAEDRAPHLEWVQRLVGKALDEARAKPLNHAALLDWQRRLERAPELVQGPSEAVEVAVERWWTLLRAALVGRHLPLAKQLWPRLSAETQSRAPALARLVEAWLEGAVEGPPEALLRELTPALAGLVPASPREVERVPHIQSLPSSREQVRDWVEDLFGLPGRFGPVSSLLRSTARSATPEVRAWLMTEAAPFVLREALTTRSAAALGAYADAVEQALEVEMSDLAIALAFAREQALSLQEPKPSPAKRKASRFDEDFDTEGPSSPDERVELFIRLARLALAKAPTLREQVVEALYRLGQFRLKFSAGLAEFFRALLGSAPPTPKLWVWAAATFDFQHKGELDDFVDALADTTAAVLDDPATTVAELERMSPKYARRAVAFVSVMLDPRVREEFLFKLWPHTGDGLLRDELQDVFTGLILEYDEAESPEVDRHPLLTDELEFEMDELLDEGLTPEDAADQLIEQVPRKQRAELRAALIAFANQPPPPIAASSRSLWQRFGPHAVRHDVERLDEGLHYIEDPPSRVPLILAALERFDDVEACVEFAHETADLSDPTLFLPDFLRALVERFGHTVETWEAAVRSQGGCRCDVTAILGVAWLHAAAKGGAPLSIILDKVKSLFPEGAHALDTLASQFLAAPGGPFDVGLAEPLMAVMMEAYKDFPGDEHDTHEEYRH